ncbi:SAM-dependent methyltransferase [Amycolatopsis sp. K13G38]|uniref:SAM-dependent methyltransferase n=1 Tax=Amycolatopsis acididurans TaxID=2724524 RepID=A0ABX1J4V7_9PSEU|nr:SAM-dependent methyltransferase [Amycolatopsis acididurans]
MIFAADWLELREPADATARAAALVGTLCDLALNRLPLVLRDMGCGTGSMGRWLAGRLPGPQHWILQDRDPALLAVATVTGPAADGGTVTFETRQGELSGADLHGTSVLTASALLDILTRDEIDGLAAACAEARCPALLTLSVSGRVEFDPPDPLDAGLTAAFNDHQRREGRLGPDAVAAAAEAFAECGMTVHTAPSPWRLDSGPLLEKWLRGWVAAACEQNPALTSEAGPYLARRLGNPDLRAIVHHTDLLAVACP